MNPQLNKIFSKLAKEDKKTELKSEKVELKNLQNVERIVKEGLDLNKKAQKFESEINSFTKKARLYYGLAEGLESGGEKMLNEFAKAAKDLGLNAKDLPKFKEAENILGVMNSIKQRLEAFSKLK